MGKAPHLEAVTTGSGSPAAENIFPVYSFYCPVESFIGFHAFIKSTEGRPNIAKLSSKVNPAIPEVSIINICCVGPWQEHPSLDKGTKNLLLK